jgi:hypothetical protein
MLNCRMTEADAAEWGKQNDCEVEKILDSWEERTGHLGWGDGPVRVTPAPGMEE